MNQAIAIHGNENPSLLVQLHAHLVSEGMKTDDVWNAQYNVASGACCMVVNHPEETAGIFFVKSDCVSSIGDQRVLSAGNYDALVEEILNLQPSKCDFNTGQQSF